MKKNNKKGFTLIEVLSVIVIIAVIGSVSLVYYINTISNSKNNSSLLAVENIKKAAELYSKENLNEITWTPEYDNEGKKSGRYVCITVNDLINRGYFNDNFFDNELYKNNNFSINKNTLIEISQDKFYSNTNVVIKNDNLSTFDCEIDKLNEELSDFKISDYVAYTDSVSFKVYSTTNNNGSIFNYKYIDKDKNIVSDKCNNDVCNLYNLKDNSIYSIDLCMNRNNGGTICKKISMRSADFKSPVIEINNELKWANTKQVSIKYNNKNIRSNNDIHLFKSGVNANVVSGSVFLCDVNGNNCNIRVNSIIKDNWYRVTELEVVLSIGGNNSNIVISKNEYKDIDGRIMDSSSNYYNVNKKITKVDAIPPVCVSEGGGNSWTNKPVELIGKCTDIGSGCKKEIITNTIKNTINSNVSPGVVYDKVGNSTVCESKKVMVDVDGPSCTNSGDSTSWAKSRTISWGCDDGSGSGCDPSNFVGSSTFNEANKEVKTITISQYTIKDVLGNITNCPARTANVYVDNKGPTCTNSGDSTSWATSRTISWGCFDGGSGCPKATVDSKTYNEDGKTVKTASISAYVIKDKLENPTSCPTRTANVYVDNEDPSCTNIMKLGSASGSNYGGGWTTSDVYTSASCNDGSGNSGCDANKMTVTTSGKTKNVTNQKETSWTVKADGISYVTYKVYDKVGNSKGCSKMTIKVDQKRPSIEWSTSSSYNEDLPYGGTTYYLKYSDETSGIKEFQAYAYISSTCNSGWKKGGSDLLSVACNNSSTKVWRAYRVVDNVGLKSKILCTYCNGSSCTRITGDTSECKVGGHTFKN